VRQCQRAVERAELIGSPTARASAYWNASVMTKEQGDVASAVTLAQKALALLELADDNRNLARLRSQLGVTQLHLDPPDIDGARANLEHAGRELAWSSASPVDVARNRLALARACYLAGELAEATEGATAVLEQAEPVPTLAAEAWVLRGQVLASRGDVAAAADSYREAAMRLTAVGADRSTAQLWFELGSLLETSGDPDAARDASRRAAASTGLRVTRPTRPVLPAPPTASGTPPHHG
jgi:tetratricopeptide (TPR) repeat protein